jgi:hypothetical protein
MEKYTMNVKHFHIEWNNHLKEKEWDPYSGEPRPTLMELYSPYQTVEWEAELEDGTIIHGKKKIQR